jgi:hypothetical protein
MAERPRNSNAPGAAHALDDLCVVSLAGALSLVIDFDGAPILKLRHGSPSQTPWVREKVVERRSVSREEVCD